MTILLTGGTGKTGLPLARLLCNNTTHSVILASRKGAIPATDCTTSHAGNLHAITFDWFERSSWENPFAYVKKQDLRAIDRVYLVSGAMRWDVSFMNDFIDFARKRGVKHIVLLSGSQAESGGNATGVVQRHLEKLAKHHPDVTYKVLKPTWFIENFGEMPLRQMIRDEDKIPSVCQDGKIPFVSAEDIASAAYKALLESPDVTGHEWFLHGPELLTYDQAASILSSVLGRTIKHVHITEEEFMRFWDDAGLLELGRGLLEAELNTAKGSEEAIFKRSGLHAEVGKVTLKEYFEKNKDLWMEEGRPIAMD